MTFTLYPSIKIPKISIEFTSPSNPVAEKAIFKAASVLKHYDIDFICVNFGGDTLSPERAMQITQKLNIQHFLPIIGYIRRSHISKNQFHEITNTYLSQNITKLFITEGRRLNSDIVVTDHYASIIDAVKAIKKKTSIKIAIEARTEHNNSEIDMIKSLIDLGIDEIITRFTFNPPSIIRFLDKISQTHILPNIRIGILPFENPSKTFLTAHRLNVAIPNELQRLFGQYDDNETINISLGMHFLLQQTQYYIQSGYDNFHIRFGRCHIPIEALCRYYNIPYNAPCNTFQSLQLAR
jgi:5,10-methylenetetrahydrofolate reductase